MTLTLEVRWIQCSVLVDQQYVPALGNFYAPVVLPSPDMLILSLSYSLSNKHITLVGVCQYRKKEF